MRRLLQPLQAVLLDHDGTLVDSEAIHYLQWVQVLAAFGVTLTIADYEQYYAGMPTMDNALDAVHRLGVRQSPEVLVAAKARVTTAYLAQSAFPLMPGVPEALATFERMGLRLGVVTGARRFAVDATVRAYAWQSVFQTVVSCDDVARSKPAPDCYALALYQMGLPASACVAIEDTEHGVSAAADAGIACIAVPTPLSKKHDFSKAQVVVPTMGAAVAWIQAQVMTHKLAP